MDTHRKTDRETREKKGSEWMTRNVQKQKQRYACFRLIRNNGRDSNPPFLSLFYSWQLLPFVISFPFLLLLLRLSLSLSFPIFISYGFSRNLLLFNFPLVFLHFSAFQHQHAATLALSLVCVFSESLSLIFPSFFFLEKFLLHLALDILDHSQ